MLEVGAIIIYGSAGICKIGKIQNISFSGLGEKKQYYILEPLNCPGEKLYVPLDNELLIKRIKFLISYEDLLELINNTHEYHWVSESRMRSNLYKDTLSNYDRKSMISIAKTLHKIKNGNYEGVKKLYSVDEDMLRKITQMLYQEFSVIVNITPEELLPFICGEINCCKK